MSKPYGYIYKITCITNNKSYIGQTTNPVEKRWKMHKTASRLLAENAIPGKSAFHSAILKYGHQNFTIETLKTCYSKEELDQSEIELIHKNNSLVPNGYNLQEGGQNGKWTIDARKRLSEQRKKLFEEHPELKKKYSQNLSYWRETYTPEEYLEYLNKLKSIWTQEKKDEHSKLVKSKWNKLTSEEQERRKSYLLVEGRASKEYWKDNNKRKEQSIRIKNSEAYINSGHTQKMKDKCAHKIKVINIITNEIQIFESKTEVLRSLQISYNSLNKALSKGIVYNDYKFERV